VAPAPTRRGLSHRRRRAPPTSGYRDPRSPHAGDGHESVSRAPPGAGGPGRRRAGDLRAGRAGGQSRPHGRGTGARRRDQCAPRRAGGRDRPRRDAARARAAGARGPARGAAIRPRGRVAPRRRVPATSHLAALLQGHGEPAWLRHVPGAAAPDARNRSGLPYLVPSAEGQRPWGYDTGAPFGEFLQAVHRARTRGVVDPRLNAALGQQEAVGADGGFLVQQQIFDQIQLNMFTGEILSRVRRIPLNDNSNGVKINVVDETSRVTGSRFGGVQGYWLDEAATKIPSQTKFYRLTLELKKVAALMYSHGRAAPGRRGAGGRDDHGDGGGAAVPGGGRDRGGRRRGQAARPAVGGRAGHRRGRQRPGARGPSWRPTSERDVGPAGRRRARRTRCGWSTRPCCRCWTRCSSRSGRAAACSRPSSATATDRRAAA
jgi:hypothetical protein